MEVLFYIIIAIIYVVFSLAGGNKKKTENQANNAPKTPQITGNEDIKLEDIIKKLTQNAQKSQSTQIQTFEYKTEAQNLESEQGIETYPSPKNYESNTFSLDNSPYETVDYDEEAIANLKEQAFQDKINERQNLLTEKYYKRPVASTFTKKNIVKKVNPFTKILQDKEALKTSFIVSEIFKTKF
jgi:hypothetical protein